MLNAVQAPYALATPVVECVEDALQTESVDEADRRIASIVHERARVVAELRSSGLVQKIWPSAANFFLARVDDVNELLEQSRRDKVLLRYFGGELADCVRITVGTAEENDRLLQTFKAVAER